MSIQGQRNPAGDPPSEAESFDDDETVDVQIIEASDERHAASDGRHAASDGRHAASDERHAASDGRHAKPEADLAPLFTAENAADYRSRWDIVQRGFVDDPARAVRDGDALLSEVINALAQTFADERSALERELTRPSEASTEALRRALQRHRAFFERLLSF